MPMIVREMILLDTLHFDSFRKPDEPSDHSGWLGPPSSVPFAWEQAPGTPKQQSLSTTPAPASPISGEQLDSNASRPEEPPPLDLAIVKVDSLRAESFEPRNSIHILEAAPAALLEARSDQVPWNSLMSFRKGSVPFKWEMEPGIARDPDKCREFLNCPLTPPPVLHSRSVILNSSRRATTRQLSVSDRMRNFFHMPLSSPARQRKKLLKVASSMSRNGAANSEDEGLSPVSVLDFSARRLSSASSATSYYYTPKGSFSWDSGQDIRSSTRSSLKSPGRSIREGGVPSSPGRKNGFASRFMQLQNKKLNNSNGGCLMMLTGANRVSSFNSYEVASSSSSEKSSSATSSSLSSSSMVSSSEHHHQQDEDSKHQLQNIESEEEDAQSAYYTPALSRLQSPAPFQQKEEHEQKKHHLGELELVGRVDSLDTVDPGFAPSDSGDDDLVLCRMASFAQWQRRGDSKKSRRSQLAKNILGVIVCCYVPGEFR